MRFKQRLQMLRMVARPGWLVLTGLPHEHHALASRQDLRRLLAGHERRHHPFPNRFKLYYEVIIQLPLKNMCADQRVGVRHTNVVSYCKVFANNTK